MCRMYFGSPQEKFALSKTLRRLQDYDGVRVLMLSITMSNTLRVVMTEIYFTIHSFKAALHKIMMFIISPCLRVEFIRLHTSQALIMT